MKIVKAVPIGALVLLFLSRAQLLGAQETSWVDTQFHRVFLRNGNAIDGNITYETPRDIKLRLMLAGDMWVAKNSIDHIEVVKMRSLREAPKVFVPVVAMTKAAPSAPAVQSRLLKLAPPEVSAEIKARVAEVLQAAQIARNEDDWDHLIDLLTRLERPGAYLASLMPDLEPPVAAFVRKVLEKTFDPDVTPYLLSALDSDRPDIQAHAIALLGNSSDPRLIERLRPLLDGGSPAVRAAAIGSLTALGDSDSLERIARLMGDPDNAVRIAAINSALRIGGRDAKMPLVARTIRELLLSSKGRTTVDLLQAAARTHEKDLSDSVEGFLRDGDVVVRRAAVQALVSLAVPGQIGSIVNRLQLEDDTPTKTQLVRLAGVLRAHEAIGTLIELLRSEDRELIGATVKSLEDITHQRFGQDHSRWQTWWEQNKGQ